MTLHVTSIELYSIQYFYSNSIEQKWDGIENMCVASIICDHGIEKKTT